jgi:hypothetical protein
MDHDDRVALPRASSAPPARGISGSECPPRPSQPLTTKPHRQAFVVLGPILGQQAASPGSPLRWPVPATWCLAGSPNRLLTQPPRCPAKTAFFLHVAALRNCKPVRPTFRHLRPSPSRPAFPRRNRTKCQQRRPTPPSVTSEAVLQWTHSATRSPGMTGCPCSIGPQPRRRRRPTMLPM